MYVEGKIANSHPLKHIFIPSLNIRHSACVFSLNPCNDAVSEALSDLFTHRETEAQGNCASSVGDAISHQQEEFPALTGPSHRV